MIISFSISIGFKVLFNYVWESGFFAKINNYIFILVLGGAIFNTSYFIYINRKWSEIKEFSTIPTEGENNYLHAVYMIGRHSVVVHRIVEVIFLQICLMLILLQLKIGDVVH